MDFFEQLEKGRYGSFELKRQVGPNMLKGLLVSLIIHSTVIASPFIIAKLFLSGEAIPPAPTGTGPVFIVPPPLVPSDPSVIPLDKIKLTRPDLTTRVKLVPVPPPEADPVDRLPADQRDLTRAVGGPATPDTGFGTGGGPVVVAPQPEDPIPPPDTFVVFEEPPAPLAGCPQPSYPELAKIAKMEGRVIVKVYVDRHGDVKKWLVMKADPTGLGFEDEVVKVVPNWRFTPAIQAGKPIGVWVSVPFKFKVNK